ncbi:penicillin-binding transpeptidase domain-containing protein [Cellulomonas sp. APG4]|uniref:penicillin-binding transpeptidase domain-containing protein n=1 Tax=Cellulomonas sp. APG4 TaxID=1538656 RepID=UPI00351BD04A
MTVLHHPRPRTGRHLAAATVVLALGVATLTACSAPDPAPDDAARALAAGLSSGDLSDVPLDDPGRATAELTAAVEPLGLRPAVEVTEVVQDDDATPRTATATLAHTWDLDDSPVDWTYTTTARLTLVETDDEPSWQVAWSPAVVAPDLSEGEVLTSTRTRAERAPVLGAGDVAIVEPRPVQRLGVDKTWVDADGATRAARALAEQLGLDADAYAERVAAAGEKAFVEAMVVRVGDPGYDVAEALEIEGVRAVDDELPLAPSRTFARAVLGTAGPATAEIVEASQGEVVAGDLAGLSGLQRQYDDQLRGTPGLTITAAQPDGSGTRLLFEREPEAGEPLRTTLDPAVQTAAEAVLADVTPAAAIVVVDTTTGAVRAVADGPGSEGLATATVGTFAPGSVFKVVSSLALLRAGLTPDSPVECPTSIEVDGRTFENFPGYPDAATGAIDLRTAVAHSCNTAFIGARGDAPPEALADAAASLGIGAGEVGATLGYPVFLGSVPTDSTGTDHAASMIGQGRVQASPLAMATVAASVAAGTTVTPWLVGAEPPEPVAPAAVLTPDEATQLRELMRAVVTDGGATFLADDGDVLAKTGTAQTGAGDDAHNHAWMIAARGDLAFAVFVEDGDYGSTTAGPLLEQLLAGVA